jgi:hypothetical protein
MNESGKLDMHCTNIHQEYLLLGTERETVALLFTWGLNESQHLTFWCMKKMDGYMDGWMDGWMDG